MSLVVDVARGAFWLAAVSSRLGFNAVVLTATAVVTVSRACQALEDASEVVGAVQLLLRMLRSPKRK
jgi:hypothetical protein